MENQNENIDTQAKTKIDNKRNEQITEIHERIKNEPITSPDCITEMFANIEYPNRLSKEEQEELDELNEGSICTNVPIEVSEEEFSAIMIEQKSQRHERLSAMIEENKETDEFTKDWFKKFTQPLKK